MDAPSVRLHRRRGRGQRGALAAVQEEADGEEDVHQGRKFTTKTNYEGQLNFVSTGFVLGCVMSMLELAPS